MTGGSGVRPGYKRRAGLLRPFAFLAADCGELAAELPAQRAEAHQGAAKQHQRRAAVRNEDQTVLSKAAVDLPHVDGVNTVVSGAVKPGGGNVAELHEESIAEDVPCPGVISFLFQPPDGVLEGPGGGLALSNSAAKRVARQITPLRTGCRASPCPPRQGLESVHRCHR